MRSQCPRRAGSCANPAPSAGRTSSSRLFRLPPALRTRSPRLCWASSRRRRHVQRPVLQGPDSCGDLRGADQHHRSLRHLRHLHRGLGALSVIRGVSHCDCAARWPASSRSAGPERSGQLAEPRRTSAVSAPPPAGTAAPGVPPAGATTRPPTRLRIRLPQLADIRPPATRRSRDSPIQVSRPSRLFLPYHLCRRWAGVARSRSAH